MVLLDFLQQGAEFHGLLPARLDRRLPTRGILLANIRQQFLGLLGVAASEVESLPLEPGRTDVVRLMNLHRAKGLEANVVFLADPGGSVRPRVDVHVERSALKAQGWLRIVKCPRHPRYNPGA